MGRSTHSSPLLLSDTFQKRRCKPWRWNISNNDSLACQPFDEFGMSLFHVLAMSTNPKYPIFAQIMRFYSIQVLFAKNPWGMRPATCAFRKNCIDYTTTVRQYIRAIVSIRIPQLKWKGWKRIIYQLLEVLCVEDLTRRSRHLVRLQRKLTMLEQFESLEILEHAVWKTKLMDGEDTLHDCKPASLTIDDTVPFAKRKRLKTDNADAKDRRELFPAQCCSLPRASVCGELECAIVFADDY